ncbi:hypothetical protein HDF16_005281 [Granulicella aggregans]|uniref:Uncharacterized protein n=1 Tax=Granulicella aggregans TaxID=474949 RepID=A0A7W8E7R2_9BACT|nr:hypothetical protein [Granulicella aggregans]MBB5060545.1 hypothetical protein [Granulicella aggregans]
MVDHSIDERVHLPLEILTNLFYLTRRESEDVQKVVGYMTIAEEQVLKLAAILG